MKLIRCNACHDVVLLVRGYRECACGHSGGAYTNHVEAMVRGPCRVLGIHNGSLVGALTAPDREDGQGVEFTAFVIPDGCPSVKRRRT